MQLKQKYIITKEERAIIFSELMNHKDFKHFDPIRAGFVWFEYDSTLQKVIPRVYGNSVSLNLKSNEELDVPIIKKEICGFLPYEL